MPDRPAALQGVLTAMLTPFDLEGRLVLDMVPTLLDFQRAAGIDGVVVCGTNGEGTSLSVDGFGVRGESCVGIQPPFSWDTTISKRDIFPTYRSI